MSEASGGGTYQRKSEITTLSRGEKVTILEVMGDGDAIIQALMESGSGIDDGELDEYLLTCIAAVEKVKEVTTDTILAWPTFDRMITLKRVRILSYSNIVNVPWVCQHERRKVPCNESNESPVDLSKIPVREPDYDAKTFDDPHFGEVVLRLSTGSTEASYVAAPDLDKLLVRVHTVGGGAFKGSKSYPGSFLSKIRKHRDRLDGNPGLSEPCVCSKCKKITRVSVICADFFGR